MKKLFKEAHKLTKEIKKEFPEVDYKFQFGLCLSYLREEESEITIEEKLISLGYKTWEKKDKEGNTTQKRIYINDIAQFAEKVGYELHNSRGYRKNSIWFNCLTGNFNYVASGTSVIKTLEEMTKLL